MLTDSSSMIARLSWRHPLAPMLIASALTACKFPMPPDVEPAGDALADADAEPVDAMPDAPVGPTFARAYGSTGVDFGAFVVASDDAIVFGGLGADGINLGLGPPVGPFFLATLTPAGQTVRALAWPGSLRDAAFDRFGNLYVVGDLDGMGAPAGPNGPILTSAGLDLFVAKFDATGRHQWSRSFGGAGSQVGQRIAIAPDDDIVVCGEFAGSTTFGGATMTERGQWDVFVTKLSRSDGAHRWSLGFGGVNEEACRGLVAAPDGTVSVFGSFFGSIIVNGSTQSGAGSFDIFAVGISQDGNVQWSRPIGGTGPDRVERATSAMQGDLLISGSFANDLTIGAQTLHSQARDDGFVARLSAGGVARWATAVSGAGLEYVSSASMFGDDVIVSGTTDGPITVGDVHVSPPAENGLDVYVARLRYADGVAVSARTYGGTGADGTSATATAAQGTVIVTGGFNSPSIDFGAGLVLHPATNLDAYLARVLPP
jgi:hypothetical protein